MPKYAALLRGVSPMNATMSGLRRAFEAAGFEDVKTVLGSGNVVFSARRGTEAALQAKAEAAIRKELGREFLTIVRSIDSLAELLNSDPWRAFKLKAADKRNVTFLRGECEQKLGLPIELDGARILAMRGREIFTAHVPGPKGPVFMRLIEATFGKEVTTRTWETVGKIVRAAD